MLEKLKDDVLYANLLLPKEKLAILTWGNVSGITEDRKLLAIKASGVEYEHMTQEHMVIVNMDGEVQEGNFRPSTDLDTHLELFKAFPSAQAIVHVHSTYATMWAQAGRGIPCLGTTHADNFYGEIPCTRKMTPDEIAHDYERNTGKVIVETFANIDSAKMNAVLVHSHGPFIWGKTPKDAIKNAMVLEYVAKMAYLNHTLPHTACKPIQDELLGKHYNRKFGANAYYGQA